MRQDIKDKFVEKSLTDKEIEKYYQDNEEMFNKPEKMRARHLLISSREKAQELLDRLKKEKINQYRFKQIVIENSEDKDTVDKGGNLMFFTIEGKRRKSLKPVNKKLAEAAFAISENGKLFPELVKTDEGYHIIMRTGHRAATNTSLEDSRERITRLMLRESRQKQMADALEALTKKYNVTLYEENLKHVVIDLSGEPVHKTDSSKRKRRRLNKR
jgi:parvulin-like peptidyl-prolyl isomerase